jgi:hypothetical protein
LTFKVWYGFKKFSIYFLIIFNFCAFVIYFVSLGYKSKDEILEIQNRRKRTLIKNYRKKYQKEHSPVKADKYSSVRIDYAEEQYFAKYKYKNVNKGGRIIEI